jgi:hypothetical protein
MKIKFSPRGANYSVAVFISPDDSRKDVEWIIKFFSPQPSAWVRIVEPGGGGRWSKIVVLPRSDRLHID